MRYEKHKQQRSTQTPAAQAAESQPDGRAPQHRNNKPRLARTSDRLRKPEEFTLSKAAEQRSQPVFEKQKDEESNDSSAPDTNIPKHLTELQSLLGSL